MFFLSIIIYIFAAIVFLSIGPIILILALVYPQGLFKLVSPFCRLMVYTFGCSISYNKKIPEDEAFVIMANHCSFLDVFAIPTVFQGKFSAIAADKNFKIPIYSTFLKRMKVVPIDRSNREQAIAGIKKAESLINEGYNIVILPEGTRTSDGNLGPFKKGGFHLAINTRARILPIITKGLFHVKPINRFTIRPSKISINVGKPIDTHNKSVDELLKETRQIFRTMINNQ